MIETVTLEDKYQRESGRIFVTALQALVRLPMLQRDRDLAQGVNTAGFISGYRGSPVGGYDKALWDAQQSLKAHHVHFQPGVNEDLAATAIWGTQQLSIVPGGRYDGIFSIWYGKGPGVDRSGDVFKHGNMAGTARHGGVLCVAGDDHQAQSSTIPHQSEHAFVAASIPVLYPANVQDYLDLGLHGFALSRYSGLWIGFKAVGDTAESSASVIVAPDRARPVVPDFPLPPGGVNFRAGDDRWAQEARMYAAKIPMALAYARANGLDRVVLGSPVSRFGLIAAGKAYLDLREALVLLGIDDLRARELGLRIYKVGMPWPLEPRGLRDFASGLDRIFVVEEKRPLIEDQIRAHLFGSANVPVVTGKRDAAGQPLLAEHGALDGLAVARALAGELASVGCLPEDCARRLETIVREQDRRTRLPIAVVRKPYFCAGCPHNTSTHVPEGSFAMAGIGCHTLALWMNRSTLPNTQMGGEGAFWMGMAPFTDTKHMFVNMGDGTYFHSGLLAVRQAVAARVSATYKILFNDAVAMTGGQPVDGPLTVPMIAWQVHAEGVARIVVVTEDPSRQPALAAFPPGSAIHHRSELDRVQRELRAVPGVTVLIYDQTCAAEKRRRRKRGLLADPERRVLINDLVCEGCGDCNVKSNCVAVEPLETDFGRKRRINQSSCNKDYSCVEGFCPSFVTVGGGRLRRRTGRSGVEMDDLTAGLPEPTSAAGAGPFNIIVTGIGGTGVVTLGALLGMAAHIEGKGCSILDETGLAQKNGAVLSHVRITADPQALLGQRIPAASAHLVLGCDLVVAGAPSVLGMMHKGHTRAVVNSHEVPTASFQQDIDMPVFGGRMHDILNSRLGAEALDFFDATRAATVLLGDSIGANPMVLGFAVQKGLLPVGVKAIEETFRINAIAVEANLRAFALGRIAAHDPARFAEMTREDTGTVPSRSLDERVALRVRFLADYQDAGYGARYAGLVDEVRRAEAACMPGRTALVDAVASSYFKLLAYKDEYEVARLYAAPEFHRRLEEQFEGDYRLSFHLAAPLFSRRDATSGHLQKREYGAWIMVLFRMLARMRRLRGTLFDPFGYTAERRTERALIAEYEATVRELLAALCAQNHDQAVEIAALPERIRGYGHVKEEAIGKYRSARERMLATLRTPLAQAA